MMNKVRKNPLFIIISTICLVVILAILLVKGFVFMKLQTVKYKVLDNNPAITSVEEVNTLGQWGEMYLEYVLEVKKGSGTLYRIWVTPDGEVTEEEVITNE